jgi:endoglucanase
LGETGENSNVWFADAINLLETNNIGWAWWPLKKLGNNNPMQIKSNPDYEKILAYWSNKGSKPTEEEAYNGVMSLASAAKLENTMIKTDVIDAMFRQPHSPTSIPFKKNPINDGTVLNSVDYDLGRNGIAYYDKDTADYHVSTGKREPGNRGNTYRNDGVDIAADSITKKYYVTHIEDGEWLQYTLNVANTGNYNLIFSFAATQEPANFFIQINKEQSSSIDIPKSNKWEPVEVKNIVLNKGVNKLRVIVERGGFDFKSIQFKKEN